MLKEEIQPCSSKTGDVGKNSPGDQFATECKLRGDGRTEKRCECPVIHYLGVLKTAYDHLSSAIL